MNKTNAMRLLDRDGISYHTKEYEVDESDLSGEHVAAQLGLPVEQVFKTLVTRGEKNGIMVFCIPVAEELMIHVKELLGLTGYIRGGCSPIGMKKKYPTWIDETAILFDEIYVSGGVRGCQIVINPEDLAGCVEAEFADLTKL